MNHPNLKTSGQNWVISSILGLNKEDTMIEKYMAQSLHIGYIDPLLTYLLASVPSILTLVETTTWKIVRMINVASFGRAKRLRSGTSQGFIPRVSFCKVNATHPGKTDNVTCNSKGWCCSCSWCSCWGYRTQQET